MKKKIFISFLLVFFTQASAFRVGAVRQCISPIVQIFKRSFGASSRKASSAWQRFSMNELREIQEDAQELGKTKIAEKAACELAKKKALFKKLAGLLDDMCKLSDNSWEKVIENLGKVK